MSDYFRELGSRVCEKALEQILKYVALLIPLCWVPLP